MLEPNYLINQLGTLTTIYSDLHIDILKSITRRMADTLRAVGEIGVMPSTLKQIETAQATGLLYDDIVRHIAATMAVATPEIRKLFEDAGIEALRYDNQIYREAGLPDAVLNQSPEMQHILKASVEKQMGSLRRMTGTIATNSQELFERTLNTAYMKTVSGSHSYTEALGEAVSDLLREGVTAFSYANNRKISVEAAVLMNIRTGVSQTAAEITKQGMIERGISYVETSAHVGARNTGDGHRNHESWQGKVFHWKELEDEPGFNKKVLQNGDDSGRMGSSRTDSNTEEPTLKLPQWAASRVTEKINAGEYSTLLSHQQYLKHVPGTAQFNAYLSTRTASGKNPQSIITISESEVQSIINEKAGTGIIASTRVGEMRPVEWITLDRVIGQYNRRGMYYSTNKVAIHYGKRSAHIVPIRGYHYD